MEQVKQILILSTYCLLLISCRNGNDKEVQHKAISISPIKQIDPLAGEWSASASIFSTATLILEPGGTFKYCTGSCFGYTYSEGKWQHVQDLIELNSFDQYKNIDNKTTFPSAKDTVKVYLQHTRFILDKDSLRHLDKNDTSCTFTFYKKKQTVLQQWEQTQ